jgi:hypothetical protein
MAKENIQEEKEKITIDLNVLFHYHDVIHDLNKKIYFFAARLFFAAALAAADKA